MEMIREHSKIAISVMWSDIGAMIHPTVAYKAQNLYEGWTTTGGTSMTACQVIGLRGKHLPSGFCRWKCLGAGRPTKGRFSSENGNGATKKPRKAAPYNLSQCIGAKVSLGI